MWYGTVTHYSSFWVIELWQISPVSGSWHCEKFFHFLGHSTVTIYSSFRTWCCDYVFQFLWYGTVIIYSSFYDNVLWQCVPVSVIWYCLWATFLLCSDIVGLQQDSSLWPTVVEMFRLWTMSIFLTFLIHSIPRNVLWHWNLKAPNFFFCSCIMFHDSHPYVAIGKIHLRKCVLSCLVVLCHKFFLILFNVMIQIMRNPNISLPKDYLPKDYFSQGEITHKTSFI